MINQTHTLGTLGYIIFHNDNQQQDEVLMMYRNKKDNDIHEGKFVGIGGKLENAETPLECIVREIKEETGYNLPQQDIKFNGYVYFDQARDDLDEEKYMAFDWLVFLYTARVTNKNKIETHEGELQWFAKDNLPFDKMWAGDKIFTPKVLEGQMLQAKIIYEGNNVKDHDLGIYE